MPVCSEIKKDNNNVVVVWHITETLDELLLLISLSDDDANALKQYKLEKRKKEWLVARILLQSVLGHYPAIEYLDNGKPYLKQGHRQISISHTFGYVAVSVSDQPTALDIEICAPRVEKVAKRFIHASEESYIQNDDKRAYLTTIWSAKEALYKYFNVFGVIFNQQFVVHPFKMAESGELNCTFIQQSDQQNLKLHYEVNNQYTLVYKL